MSSIPSAAFPKEKLVAAFVAQFGALQPGDAYWAEAPGRVNLIGEHTDYHGGFVFPAALDLRSYILARPRADRKVNVFAMNLGESFSFDLDVLHLGSETGWRRYVAGPAWALISEGCKPAQGVDAVVYGTVPFGGGLSSSASIEVAWITLFNVMNGWQLLPRRVAEIGKLAENRFVGVPCGIMDQFASAACAEGQALMLDCRSYETRSVPIPKDWRLVVCDTGVKHELANGEYAKRQDECRLGLDAVTHHHPEVELLRDVTLELLDSAKGDMSERSYRRCRYVILENARVLAFAEALEKADAQAAGRLMAASHAGLATEYEVSCEELDRAVAIANTLPGLIGARMTGGGFGGSTVNLVHEKDVDNFCKALGDAYKSYSGGKGRILAFAPGSGAKGGRLA